MYAYSFINIIKDDIAILEDRYELPSNLVLRFAKIADQKAIRSFLKQHGQQTTEIEAHISDGRIVILYAPEQRKVYGYAAAYKTRSAKEGTCIKIDRPLSSIPWVGLNQMMVAALRLKQRARQPRMNVMEENYADLGVFENDQEAEEYLKRADNIRSVVSSGNHMALDLSAALESIQHIKQVRQSLLLRCGSR